jgi:hypothetical protein
MLIMGAQAYTKAGGDEMRIRCKGPDIGVAVPKFTVPLMLASLALCATARAQSPAKPAAKPAPYTGADYSGSYQCTGKDAADGDFTGKITLTLNRKQSSGNYGAYDFRLEAPPFGVYLGEAAAQGRQMAMRFANTDQKDKDYGTGIASFSKGKGGKWRFSSYYYEPEYKGGNYGTENCVQQ